MERGDHLISPRIGYSHHGLYLGRNQVIHYSGFSDGRHKGTIAITTLEEFCQGEGFTIQTYPFRLYDHEESAKRALSRLGEDWYDILLNNCEHFITWCILGLHSSHQVNRAVMASVAAHTLLKESATRTVVPPLVSVISKETAHCTVGAAAGMAVSSGLATSGGITTALVGLTTTPAAPLAVALAAGAAVGLGVTKLVDWMMD